MIKSLLTMLNPKRPARILALLGLALFSVNFCGPCHAAQWDVKEEKAACPESDTCSLEKLLAVRQTPLMLAYRRGSKKDHALGQYQWQPILEYQSGYENLPADLQFGFAQDLHNYLKGMHYTWPAVQKKLNFDFLPYHQQGDFAKQWWLKHDPGFEKLGPVAQDKFVHDALVDATNIYGIYARRYWDSPQYEVFEATAVTRLVEKK
jgi:hypothetical protein